MILYVLEDNGEKFESWPATEATRADVIEHLSYESDVVGMYWCEKHAQLIECEWPGCTEELKPIYLVPRENE